MMELLICIFFTFSDFCLHQIMSCFVLDITPVKTQECPRVELTPCNVSHHPFILQLSLVSSYNILNLILGIRYQDKILNNKTLTELEAVTTLELESNLLLTTSLIYKISPQLFSPKPSFPAEVSPATFSLRVSCPRNIMIQHAWVCPYGLLQYNKKRSITAEFQLHLFYKPR